VRRNSIKITCLYKPIKKGLEAEIQCTVAEMAVMLDVSTSKLEADNRFIQTYKKGLENGKKSLRRLPMSVFRKSIKRGRPMRSGGMMSTGQGVDCHRATCYISVVGKQH